MAESMVLTDQLTKRYREVTALRDCSLTVQSGEVFGLLGPNGAGKTTLLRLLLGYLHPTSGHARVAGFDCLRESLAVRSRVAYLPGEVRLFRRMRGRDMLRFFADIRGGITWERVMAVVDRLELDVTRRVSSMSTGMRQKLALAAALASDAPLLILDEPTSNLDPTVRGTVLELVEEARERGRTVVFSSHVLSEVEHVCDRVAILRRGELVHTQVMAELRRRHRIRAILDGVLPDVPADFQDLIHIESGHDRDVMMETAGELAPLLGWLSTLPLEQIRIEPLGLRAVYDVYQAVESVDGVKP